MTTFVCTSTTFVNASWQSAGWPWWHVVPLKVLSMQHLRIIFDFNALDMMQIFKSIPMVVNWYKTEIAQYFYKWCFFYIYYQTENMNRKGIMWVKASEGTAMPCGFTRHPQHGMGKSPSKCYNTKLGRCIPVVKFSTSFTFGGILSETFSTILFVKFRMRFRDWYFKIKSGICYISAKNGSIATKQKANISIER